MRVIDGYGNDRDALVKFGREVRRIAAAEHLRYEVLPARDESMLLYLERPRFYMRKIEMTGQLPDLDGLVVPLDQEPWHSLESKACLRVEKKGEPPVALRIFRTAADAVEVAQRLMNVVAVQTQALRSPATLFSICLVMVMLVGYLDYISGVENSMLLLYLVPITLATSMRGIPAGIVCAEHFCLGCLGRFRRHRTGQHVECSERLWLLQFDRFPACALAGATQANAFADRRANGGTTTGAGGKETIRSQAGSHCRARTRTRRARTSRWSLSTPDRNQSCCTNGLHSD